MYTPPFAISARAINLISEISANLERFAIRMEMEDGIMLRKVNRMKTIHGTLAIEGNTLSEEQVTALHKFEFIHPFMDGNGRMGRFWQSRLLAEWNPVFAHLPIENMIWENQSAYYKAIQDSTDANDSGIFVDFMLGIILEALKSHQQPDYKSVKVTVKVTQKVTVNQHIKSDGGNFMANGIEDLHEKNKEEQSDDKSASTHYNEWRVFQGREDAEMLREKSLGWSSKKDYLGDYDDNERDY